MSETVTKVTCEFHIDGLSDPKDLFTSKGGSK